MKLRYYPIHRVYLVLAVVCTLLCHCEATRAQTEIDFKRDIAPILIEHCVECHNASIEMAALRLDNRESATASGTIDPGDSEGSLLVQRLHDKELGITMPPGGKIPPSEVDALERWIDAGADWPADVKLTSLNDATKENPVTRSLYLAIRAGKVGAVRRIVQSNGYREDTKDRFGSTPLHQAAWLGDAKTLKYLLSLGLDVNAANDAGVTPLMLAVSNLPKTKLLLDRGADPNARSVTARSPLMLAAAKSKNSSILKQLLSAGADVWARDNRNWTSLILASRTGDAKMLKRLLDAGADVNASDRKGLVTPLTQAAWTGDLDSVNLLLDRGADQNEKSLNYSLIVAATHGYEGMVRVLLEAGADPNATEITNYIPDTPLQAAAYCDHGSLKIVSDLIDKGAVIEAVGENGESATSYAAKRGRTKITRLLTQSSQDPNSHHSTSTEPGLAANPEEASRVNKQAAIKKSLSLLQSCDLPFFGASGCVACHQQSTTSIASSLATAQGFTLDQTIAGQRQKLLAFELRKKIPTFWQRLKIGGTTHRIGYLAWGLAASEYPPSIATDAAVYELSGLQLANGSWVSDAHRPPSEYSPFSATAVSIRAMQAYTPPSFEKQFQKQFARARKWLESATPRENQEFAFQLLGLKWTDASQQKIAQACDALLASQNDDGGWSQLQQLPSDAYATGLALFALHIGGNLATTALQYNKGVSFLLRTQDRQGAWHVKSRSFGFQPYFESGFPYEHDQWISSAATGWATAALLLCKPSNE